MVDTIFQIIGYLGMMFVLVSFMMKDIVKIRVLNLIGAVLTIIYALQIMEFPVLILNGSLFIIQIYYLIKIHLDRKKEKANEQKEVADSTKE